jgi:hypothetical protein
VRSPEFLLIFLVFVFGNFREATPSSDFPIKTQHGNKRSLFNELFELQGLVRLLLSQSSFPLLHNFPPRVPHQNFASLPLHQRSLAFPGILTCPPSPSAENPAPLHFPYTPSSPTWKVRYEVDKVMEEKIWGMKRVGARNR